MFAISPTAGTRSLTRHVAASTSALVLPFSRWLPTRRSSRHSSRASTSELAPARARELPTRSVGAVVPGLAQSRMNRPCSADLPAWYTWYTEAVASGRIAVANGRIFRLNPADRRPFPSLCVRLRPFSTRLAEGSIPGASISSPRNSGAFLLMERGEATPCAPSAPRTASLMSARQLESGGCGHSVP